MCDPVSMSIAAAAAAAGTQLAGGFAARDAANAEARNLRTEGAQAMDAANFEAGNIRKAGQRDLATAESQQAKYGVTLDSASSVEVGKGIVDAFETDAQTALYQGRLRHWQKNAAAQQARHAGKTALIGSFLSAGTTLLSGAAKAPFGQGGGMGANIGGAANRPAPQLLPGGG